MGPGGRGGGKRPGGGVGGARNGRWVRRLWHRFRRGPGSSIGPSGVVPTAPKRARTGSAKQLKSAAAAAAAAAGVGVGVGGARERPRPRGRVWKVRDDDDDDDAAEEAGSAEEGATRGRRRGEQGAGRGGRELNRHEHPSLVYYRNITRDVLKRRRATRHHSATGYASDHPATPRKFPRLIGSSGSG